VPRCKRPDEGAAASGTQRQCAQVPALETARGLAHYGASPFPRRHAGPGRIITKKLEGKTAFITGAAAGIGRATVELFAAEGARVIATDRDLAGLDGLNADKRKLDVTDAAAIAQLGKEIGRVDVLFNCAGFVENGTILDNDDVQWARSF
jgi:NADPH:quinone reductase-like Zn-dependent oxidoreductase